MLEKRRKGRVACVGKVFYTDCNGGPDAPLQVARCSNICRTGMCVFTSDPIPAGSVIRISKVERANTRRPANVRWCEKLDDHLYREGISYMR